MGAVGVTKTKIFVYKGPGGPGVLGDRERSKKTQTLTLVRQLVGTEMQKKKNAERKL